MQNQPRIQFSKIGVFSVAHALNDLYSNYLPQMFPFLVVLSSGFTACKSRGYSMRSFLMIN